MNGERVEPALTEGLDDATAEVLLAYAEERDRGYRLNRWFVNGRSRAPVAVVVETSFETRKTERVVLKAVRLEDQSVSDAEFVRHRKALREAPPEFAAKHLVGVRDSWRVGKDKWIAFQELAGYSNLETITALLCHMLDLPTYSPVARGTPKPKVEDFAGACGKMIGTILHEWTGAPYQPEAFSVRDVLRKHVHGQLSDEKRLLPWADRYRGRTIGLSEEKTPLPNPFFLADGGYFKEDPGIHLISGRTHGDLHADNVLVVAHPEMDGSRFSLIDLALYESDGPVTRDPVHFLLYVLARSLSTMEDLHDQLITLLLDPGNAHVTTKLPPWITSLVRTVDDTCQEWARRGRLEEDWRPQSLLSLVGCSLLFLGRSSTRQQDKPWFLRLAARASAEFVAEHATAATLEPLAEIRPAPPPDVVTRALAKTKTLRTTLHVRKVHTEVRRKFVDDSILPAVLAEGTTSVIAIKGDAGIGKSTIAGQLFDALSEHDGVIPLIIPCQHLLSLPATVGELDEAVGVLLEGDRPLSELAELLSSGGGRVMAVFDTVDNLLEAKTSRVVVELFARLAEMGVPVAFTTRPYHFNAWIDPHRARLGGALTPVSVPHLDHDEVVRIVSGYMRLHPSRQVASAAEFASDLWEPSRGRPAMALIVENPYFLLMLCETFAENGVVPPDLTTTSLCDSYVTERVLGSRRYDAGDPVLHAKRLVWQLVAGELWARSQDQIALTLPLSWLDEHVQDHAALDDLLSEEVLVRSTADPTVVQFNHQFLAEFSMAIHLRDRATDELHKVLDRLHEAPGERWFAWQVVRHVIARTFDSGALDDLLDRLHLEDSDAYQATAQGLVEQRRSGYLATLGNYPQHYASLFWLDVLFFVDDDKVGEAVLLLAEVVRRGSPNERQRACLVAGKLVARSADVARNAFDPLSKLLEVVAAECASEADHLLENLLAPLSAKDIALPDAVLARARDCAPKCTGVCLRALIRAHLVSGVGTDARSGMLDVLLKHGNANKVGPLAVELVLTVIEWDVEDGTAGRAAVRPADFLYASGKAGQLRSASLAEAAVKDSRLRPAVVTAFVTASEPRQVERALVCLQEAVKRGGQEWVLARLRLQDDAAIAAVAFRLGGLAKTVAAQVRDRAARTEWADWLAPHVSTRYKGNVDAYLQLGWDDQKHLRAAIATFEQLDGRARQSLIANFALVPSPGKDAVLAKLQKIHGSEPPVLLKVRMMDVDGDDEPAGLVDMVSSSSAAASAQAMTKLARAADNKARWLTPELLERFAVSKDPKIRTGVLKVVAALVRRRAGDVDGAIVAWVGGANARRDDKRFGSDEELRFILQLCHSYLRDDRGAAPAAIEAVETCVDRAAQADPPPAARRELLALAKTAAWSENGTTREKGAEWLLILLAGFDVQHVKEGHSFSKQAMGKLVENGHIRFDELVDQVSGWPRGNLFVAVDLVQSHHPLKADWPGLDAIAAADPSGEVEAYIAARRKKDR